jgi:glycosyltransferase A (GT-A) superfamily protein (DUF2064 family)
MRTAVAEIDNAAIPTCGIAVMAKASIAGRTKTRLVPPLTFDEAAQCNTAFLRDIADNHRRDLSHLRRELALFRALASDPVGSAADLRSLRSHSRNGVCVASPTQGRGATCR